MVTASLSSSIENRESPTVGPARTAAPLDPASVISSLALFMIGAFMILEMIAFWGFGADAGFLGVLAATAIGLALTVTFRDRMRGSDAVVE